MKLAELSLNVIKWKETNLHKKSFLTADKIAEVFAPQFKIITNERSYDANYENYLEFLQGFCRNLENIRYDIQEVIEGKSAVAIPMVATLKETKKPERLFDKTLILKFDNHGLVIHWQEIYSERK